MRNPCRFVLVLVQLVLLLGPAVGWPGTPARAQGQEAAVPLIESRREGVTLTWTLPPYQVTSVQVDGTSYSRLEMEGVPPAGALGAPQLPLYSALIGLPPGATAHLEVVAREVKRVHLPHPPLPVLPPRPILGDGDARLSELSERDATIYATDAFYPAEAITLSSPATVRGHRVVALRIYPLRVNPVRQEVEVIRHVQLAVHFSRPAPEGALSGQSVADDPVRQALAGVLLNPEATGWVGSAPSRSRDAQVPQPVSVGAQANGGQIKVLVRDPGLYALSYSTLQAAGVPVDSIDPATWRMTHGYPRQEVAIQVESARILFYAVPNFSRYTDTDVYFLSYGGSSGLRMTTRSGDPTGLPEGIAYRTVIAEQNRHYEPKYAGRDGDRWFWDKLQRPDRASASYTIRLDAPRTDTPATLTVWLQGYTELWDISPDHRVRFTFNGSTLGEQNWDGKRAITATLTVPGSLLLDGDNQVGLSLPGLSGVTIEGTWLDAIALRYATCTISGQVAVQGESGRKRYVFTVNNPGDLGSHCLYLPPIQKAAGPTAAQDSPTLQATSSAVAVYDITQPFQPQIVTGFQLTGSTLTIGDADTSPADYLIVPPGQEKVPLALQQVKSLSTPPGGADYVVITHPDFAAAAGRLAAHRADQGLRTAVVDVEAIYDTFGPGRMDAQAIRNFLAHTCSNWTPAPYYVVLLGDGSYDFKNHSGYNPRTYVPPFLENVDPWWGETATDNRLVTLAGDDTLPDMLIGRLPANTLDEASAMVGKLIDYETKAVQPWFLTQLIVADNPDDAGDFHAEGDSAYIYAGAPFSPLRLYYAKPATQPYMYSDAKVLKNTLIDRINSGAGLVTYFGHSSWHQWAVENLFHLDDVARLNNQTRLPVVLEMTCFTAFFHHPQYPTLDESLVRWAQGGVVAAWGSTGLGVTLGHSRLHHGFYTAVRAGSGGARLGAGTLAGKLAVWGSGVDLDLLDTFTLLGDPATTVRFNDLPAFQRVFLPVIRR